MAKYDTYGAKVRYLQPERKILAVKILNFSAEKLNSEYEY